ncbi:MAG: lamin tail domain-containing protein [Saprospiraceae bacterium]|nr:lamin tail domain-containing protein [Saprospiraceae bacterium]
MKRIFTFFVFVLATSALFSQDCGELFISEYIEGYGNNRALELYNPTDQTIDLSQYSVGRFSNGSTEFTGVQIPAGNFIEPNDAFVIVIDKRDQMGTGLETPIWNGYQLWDVCLDEVTMEPIIDQETGDTIYCVQYDAGGTPLVGTEYHDFLDLEGKGDVFLTPIYNINNALYWNGNDAVALIKGTDVAPDGSNIIDVIGVIGEDPENTIGEPAWVDENGYWVTRDRTLVRKKEVKKGTGPVVFLLGDTFDATQWESYPKNTFIYLGAHDSDCATSGTKDNFNQVEVQVYPNPLQGNTLTIESAYAVKSAQLFNLTGQLVHSVYPGNNTGTFTVATGDLQKGCYTLVLDLGEYGMISRKLVK